MEADDVVREQAREDLLADPRGQHPPGVGLRPGDVDEVVQEDVRAGFADEVGERVEVVVVDHHDRLGDALELLDDRAGEVLVDDVVAELEGLDLLAADVRRVREIPQVVLDEPQHRVGEDVVEAVVGLGVGDDEPDLELAPRRASAPGRRGRRARARPRRRTRSSPRRSRSLRGARPAPSAPSPARPSRAAPRRRRGR